MKSWSFSSLTMYESCPQKWKLRYIDKHKEQDNAASARGTETHALIENYLANGTPLPADMGLASQYEELRTKSLVIEENWGFDEHWKPADWDTAICRMKLDVFIPEEAKIIDHKTGKINPVKHVSQGQLYAIGASILYPELEEFHIEFWYTDQNHIAKQKYSLKNVEKFKKTYNMRVARFQSDTQYNPISNKGNCKYCPYGNNGSAICEFRYEE